MTSSGHPRVSLDDLKRGQGPPLTTSQLASMVGMSPTFIREEIKLGELRAVRIGHGRKPVFRILVCEAARYVHRLGLI